MEDQKDYLLSIEDELPRPAPIGLRLANCIIDLIVYYVLSILVSFLLIPITPWMVSFALSHEFGYELFFLALALFIYWLYYFLMEGFSKGKTVGKLITGTKAVSADGQTISWKNAALRSLARLVPFEPFSAFGGFPWHDSWPYTMVIKERK